jgi:CRISPR/Cas system-associated protein Cas5 (RAMP superfamily)
MAGGGGQRKYGRGKRKPSHQRYVAEGRREKNKARKQEKIKKELERKVIRKDRKKADSE